MKNTAGYHYEQAKLIEFAAKYEALGYSVRREVRLHGFMFDMVAEKGAEKVFVEVLYKPASGDKIEHIAQLREVANGNGATDFKVILFDLPKETDIKIDGLEEALSAALEQEDTEASNIGHGATYNDIYLGNIDSVKIDEDGIRICGDAEVDVDIHVGSGDDAEEWHENFPFSYDITLDIERKLQDVHTISVDTSSFYE